MRHRIAVVAGLLLALGAFAPNAFAGTARTQTNIHVFVDCVTQSSGTYDATFGYKNDNSTAQTVVVGSDNYFTPPPIDRGQTTTFQPGTVHNAFTVKAIPNATKLTWTVSLNGHTESVNVSASSSHGCATTPSPAIHVSVDCVTKGATTYDATFAYSNDGSSAQTVPVGSDNYFSPPPIDRGQTTVFQAGSHHAAFTVKDIPNATKLTWSVASGNSTRTATASSSGRACAPTMKVIHVAVDCVTKGATTYDATFAYSNDNATAQTVPVGSDNFFSPPPIDRAQTTVFQPGTHHAAFTVTGIPNATKLTWTVAFGGSTRTTTAHSSDRACAPTAKVIHLAVDCVTRGASTYDATFAYSNDNATTQAVPVGSDNFFSPPPIDRGQTTSFQPGTHHAAFTVKGIPNTTKLTWTVAFGGSSRSTTASSSGRSCTPTAKVIHIAVDCVTRGATTYDATFAYSNDNATAQTVPVGSDNFFSPPPIDRAQTTVFQPGTHHAAFVVTGIPNATKLTWTVAFGGSTRTTTARSSDRSCGPRVKPVEVFVECVTRHNGTYDATFGYANANATAQTVPIGNDNYFSPPPGDRGQTSTFQPGTVHAAFTVTGIPSRSRLTWTVNSAGRSDRATATVYSHRCVAATPPPKVTICHRTNNSKKRWVQITVNARTAAWLLRHGDVRPTANGCPAPRKHHRKHHGGGNQSSNQIRQEKRR